MWDSLPDSFLSSFYAQNGLVISPRLSSDLHGCVDLNSHLKTLNFWSTVCLSPNADSLLASSQSYQNMARADDRRR